MAMMVNRKAPYSGVANLMALQGRGGDTELVHMSKPEVRGLQSLGQLTVNPDTGLPEAFKLGDALKVALPIAASFAAPYLAPSLGITSTIGASALGAGLGGLASLATGQSLDKALFGAAASFGLGQIMSGLGGTATSGQALDAAGNVTNMPQITSDSPLGKFLSSDPEFAGFFDPQQIAQAEAMGKLGGTNLGAEAALKASEVGSNYLQEPSTMDKIFGSTYGEFRGKAADAVAKAAGEKAGSSLAMTGFLPLGIGAAGLLTPDAEPYQDPEKKPTTITPQEMYVTEEGAGAPTQQTALDIALRGGAERQLPTYGYRNLPSYTVAKTGGLIGLAEGGMPEQVEYFEGRVDGNGDGMSDEVEFEVEGENPDMAMLSRDEYVLPADVVAILGNGSSEAGADKLDMFVKQTRKEAFGTEKQQKEMKGDGGLSSLVA